MAKTEEPSIADNDGDDQNDTGNIMIKARPKAKITMNAISPNSLTATAE